MQNIRMARMHMVMYMWSASINMQKADTKAAAIQRDCMQFVSVYMQSTLMYIVSSPTADAASSLTSHWDKRDT